MRVLILGANSDVAEALGSLLASKGHDLILAGRSDEKLEALRSDLSIRFNIQPAVSFFNAEDLASSSTFYDSLQPKPDWVVCAFGVLVEQDEVDPQNTLWLKSYMVNLLGAVSILDARYLSEYTHQLFP